MSECSGGSIDRFEYGVVDGIEKKRLSIEREIDLFEQV